MVMRSAVVTGGSGDIGFAIGKALIDDGYIVGLLDIDGQKLQQRCDKIGAVALPADVTNEADTDVCSMYPEEPLVSIDIQ